MATAGITNAVVTTATRKPAKLDAVLLAELQKVPNLRNLSLKDLSALEGVEEYLLPEGEVPVSFLGDDVCFWVLLEGELQMFKLTHETPLRMFRFAAGETFGEVPLLAGRATNANSPSRLDALQASRLLRVPGNAFWKLLADCPQVREAVLADNARRWEVYQVMQLHREKLISLGTLAAGLMHELNNPGAAARRAASNLRENILRLQQISLEMCKTPLSKEQKDCLYELQQQVFSNEKAVNGLSSIEESDREEELCTWLEEIAVENPWRLAPTLAGAGWSRGDIECAQASFPPAILSMALNYLDALINSMQQVGTIEESIARVTDLVMAVKKYAYDDKGKDQLVDVRDTLISTLTILSHKLRQKNIQLHRELPDSGTKISCAGSGLAQVWTNLLDNAIDAAPENGRVDVRVWVDEESVRVGIRDNGPGIPPEVQKHIFEPFYTTKEEGRGTGLGLEIARRIVVGNFGGQLEFTSEPGATEFMVRLPLELSSDLQQICSVKGIRGKG